MSLKSMSLPLNVRYAALCQVSEWSLAGRSTRAPTASHLAREAPTVYAAPRGQCIQPLTSG